MKMKLERVTINVKNLDEAKRFFSELLDTTFEDFPDSAGMEITPRPDTFVKFRAAVSPIGIELFEPFPPVDKEGIRNVTWRVDDIEEARKEMKARGIRHVFDTRWGQFKEAVYSADDMHGVRWVLNEFPGNSAVEAARKK